MSTPPPPTTPTIRVSDPAKLVAGSRDFADEAYRVVGAAYLEFRRVYYHDPNPSLATQPTPITEVQRTETARIGAGTLSALPGEVKAAPIVHDLVNHLQKMVDIQSLTEVERTQLHNMSMAFLYGVKDGVQAWFVEWMLQCQEQLQHVTHDDYYVHFPWQGLLYRQPDELVKFEAAVRNTDVTGILREVGHYGDRLTEVLAEPVKTQYDLAFSGPGGERKKIVFNLKTTAGLALGAYLTVEATRALVGLGHREAEGPPLSLINDLPPALTQALEPHQG